MYMLLLYQEEGAAEAEWADEPSEVAHLTDTTFDPFIAAHNSTLVMFYAPWYDRVSVFAVISMLPSLTQWLSILKFLFCAFLSKPDVISPRCGHCKKMKPSYTETAGKMKEEEVEGKCVSCVAVT